MRLICFLAAIAVLFCLSDASAQTAYAPDPASAGSPSARAAGLRLLTWPGKVEPSSQTGRPRAAARTWTSRSYSGLALRGGDGARPQTLATASAPAPRRAWDPAPKSDPALPAASQPAALPTSIYAPAPPPAVAAAPIAPARQIPAAPRATALAAANETSDYQPTHFYSLHRQYGDTPDPIPLDAQFFASSSPDLAQPPPPLPRTVTTTGGRVIQAPTPSPDDVPG
jgi:hypothetical protein